jgi:hypothetical protein
MSAGAAEYSPIRWIEIVRYVNAKNGPINRNTRYARGCGKRRVEQIAQVFMNNFLDSKEGHEFRLKMSAALASRKDTAATDFREIDLTLKYQFTQVLVEFAIASELARERDYVRVSFRDLIDYPSVVEELRSQFLEMSEACNFPTTLNFKALALFSVEEVNALKGSPDERWIAHIVEHPWKTREELMANLKVPALGGRGGMVRDPQATS